MDARLPRWVVIGVVVAATLGAAVAGIALVTGDRTPPPSRAPIETEAARPTTAEAPTSEAETATSEATPPATTAEAPPETTPSAPSEPDVPPTEPATTEELPPDDLAVPMPAVVGLRLDVAKQALDAVGVPYAVDGGGLFGVFLDDSWTVCETDPAASSPVAPGVTALLRVSRTCE